jgi:GT2 family glycosyltransferase
MSERRSDAPEPGTDVTVVVASRNRREELLRSLPRHEAPVILLDNGSSDGTPAAVRSALPQADVVELGRNLGAPARNLGVARATTPFVAFADDDSWWATGALARAADHLARHPRLGLLAGRVLVGPQEQPDPISVAMARAPLGRADDLPGPDVLGFMACGAVMRREAFLSVGGFDEVVFFPGEEERVALDLESAGWGLAYVDDVVAHHWPSSRRWGAAERSRLTTRNALLTACMRRPWPVVAEQTLAALRQGGARRAGVLDAAPRLPGALRARHRVPERVERRVRALSRAAGVPGDR